MCIRTGQMPYYGFHLAYASEMLHLISPYYGDFIMRIAREGLVALGAVSYTHLRAHET